MQKYEIRRDNVLPEEADNYANDIIDLFNIFYAGASSVSHLGRTTEEDALNQVDRFIVHAQKKAAQIRKSIDTKKVHDKAHSAGHALGYDTGRALGYEEGVRDTHQAFPHLESYLDQITKSGAGLTIIAIERDAYRDFPNR